MTIRKKLGILLGFLLIIVGVRIGYLAFKYPNFKEEVFRSGELFSYQNYDYEISDGEVVTANDDKELEGKLMDDEVALKFHLKTTDLRIISDYLLYIDGQSFYPSYELLEKINDNEYVLSYTISKKIVDKYNQKGYIALPNQTVNNQIHAVVKVSY